jgi:hypothetical protein
VWDWQAGMNLGLVFNQDINGAVFSFYICLCSGRNSGREKGYCLSAKKGLINEEEGRE